MADVVRAAQYNDLSANTALASDSVTVYTEHTIDEPFGTPATLLQPVRGERQCRSSIRISSAARTFTPTSSAQPPIAAIIRSHRHRRRPPGRFRLYVPPTTGLPEPRSEMASLRSSSWAAAGTRPTS